MVKYIPPLAIPFSGWELIKTGTFTEKIGITGLDGNTDKVYMLLIRAYRIGAEFNLSLRFNNTPDTSKAYTRSIHGYGYPNGTAQHTTTYQANTNGIALGYWDHEDYFCIIFIQAKTGAWRMITGHSTGHTTATDYSSADFGGIYESGADNITEIDIVPLPLGTTINFGEYWLFRLKS
jgi:hypothetical protein